nr:hypothetical protein [Tanacetum cinerariifolium]
MSTQQDIYAVGSETRPPMLNKDNYVPWSSRLLLYARSRPNGKLIFNSIKNGPYTDEKLTDKELKQVEADDQVIQTILLGLPEDIYATTKDVHEVDYTQLYDFLKMNQEENARNQTGLIVVLWIAHPNANQNGNGNVVVARDEVRPRRRDAAYLQTQLLIAQKKEAVIQLYAEEFDLMADAWDLDEIKEVNANCILMANLQQASTSSTQTDKASIYDSDGSAELLEHISAPHLVQQNDSNVISGPSSAKQSGGTVEQNSTTNEELRAYHESLFNNLAVQVEKVNTVNSKMKEANAELTTKLARYKNQEKCYEISEEKYDKLKMSYQNFGVDAVEDFKEYMLRDYYCLLKTYCCWYKLKLLDNAADNYVPWSSRIIRYARSRPNGKMIIDSIENGPYVRRIIATPGEPDLPVPVPESLHEQTDEELTETDIKRMDADDQAIQTILLDPPEDVYAAVDSCETSKEIWERVHQMMK